MSRARELIKLVEGAKKSEEMDMDKEPMQDKEEMMSCEKYMEMMDAEMMPEMMGAMVKKMENIEDPEYSDEPDLDDMEENTKLFKDAKQFMVRAAKAMSEVKLKKHKKK